MHVPTLLLLLLLLPVAGEVSAPFTFPSFKEIPPFRGKRETLRGSRGSTVSGRGMSLFFQSGAGRGAGTGDAQALGPDSEPEPQSSYAVLSSGNKKPPGL